MVGNTNTIHDPNNHNVATTSLCKTALRHKCTFKKRVFYLKYNTEDSIEHLLEQIKGLNVEQVAYQRAMWT